MGSLVRDASTLRLDSRRSAWGGMQRGFSRLVRYFPTRSDPPVLVPYHTACAPVPYLRVEVRTEVRVPVIS
jgi:hypothetical protein